MFDSLFSIRLVMSSFVRLQLLTVRFIVCMLSLTICVMLMIVSSTVVLKVRLKLEFKLAFLLML